VALLPSRFYNHVRQSTPTGISRFFEIIFMFRWLGVKRQCSCKTMLLRTRAEQHDNGYKKNGITILDWPGNSADLNPIENLWSVLKVSVRQKNVKNEAELRTVIQEAWEFISPTYCANLISSMPERLRQVFASQKVLAHLINCHVLIHLNCKLCIYSSFGNKSS
jgi:hypothetical protein